MMKGDRKVNYENEYEEKYQKMIKAYKRAEKTDSSKDWEEYRCCVEDFGLLCQDILAELLKKDSDILKRLKERE